MKRSSVAMALCLVVVMLSGVVASANNGYFVRNNLAGSNNIAAGPGTNQGPFVTAAQVTVLSGKYLVTAVVRAQSYGPSSGASCYLEGPLGAVQYNSVVTLDTSSNWTNLAKADTVIVGAIDTAIGGTVKISCLKRYGATNASEVKADLSLVSVDTLN